MHLCRACYERKNYLILEFERYQKATVIYQGSKKLYNKYILPITLKDRKEGQWYVEPFVGGCNSFEAVANPRLGSELNPWVLLTLNAIRDGWVPPKSVSIEEYKRYRKEKPMIPETGFIGIACSFGARWFEGYARNSTKHDYALGGHNSALKQSPKLKGSELVCCSYDELDIPDNSIIYCDPPYKNTKRYHKKFDHDMFYDWCRQKKQEGHSIFVSEIEMPDDFICVWEKEMKAKINAKAVKKRYERLFTL